MSDRGAEDGYVCPHGFPGRDWDCCRAESDIEAKRRAVGIVCEECILSKHSFVVLGMGDGGPCPEHRAAVAPRDHDVLATAATPESAPVGPEVVAPVADDPTTLRP